MNAIPDKFAQWDAAYVLGAPFSCGATGVRGASGQLSGLPGGRLGTGCPARSASPGLTSGRSDVVAGG